jgi:hypothetical protein
MYDESFIWCYLECQNNGKQKFSVIISPLENTFYLGTASLTIETDYRKKNYPQAF